MIVKISNIECPFKLKIDVQGFLTDFRDKYTAYKYRRINTSFD